MLEVPISYKTSKYFGRYQCFQQFIVPMLARNIALETKFSIKGFLSKCGQIRSFLRIWSHLLKKSLMESIIFCAMKPIILLKPFILGKMFKELYLETQRRVYLILKKMRTKFILFIGKACWFFSPF